MDVKELSVLSLEEFVSRYKEFSSEDGTNKACTVQITANFEQENPDDDIMAEGLIPISATAYHDGVNFNNSSIDTEVFKERTKTINYRPILAYISENESGVRDFVSHSYRLTENEYGEETFEWLEQPIGVLTGQYDIVHDEAAHVNRAVVKGYLYSDYCDEAIEIMKRRKKCHCSIELVMNKYSYDDSTKILSIDDYYIRGLTLLGEDFQPGMQGSQVVIEEKRDSEISAYVRPLEQEYEERLKKIESVLFSLSEMTSDKQKGEESVENNISTYLVVEQNGEQLQKFDISYSDKEYAVCKAFYDRMTDAEDKYTYRVVSVLDDCLVYSQYGTDKYWRLNYVQTDEAIQFNGDAVDVDAHWATKEERTAEFDSLQSMKEELESVKSKLAQYEQAELQTQKESVLADEAYADFLDTKEFKEVKEKMSEFSLDELKVQAELAFAACARKQKNKSSVQNDETFLMKFTNPNVDDVKIRKRYGAIFED